MSEELEMEDLLAYASSVAKVAVMSRTPEGRLTLAALGFIKPECLNEAGRQYLEIALEANGMQEEYQTVQEWKASDVGGPEDGGQEEQG